MAKFLVTGGAGFIGSHIVERLVKEGHSVRVLDDLSTGELSNLQPIIKDIDFVLGSVCDADVCRKSTQGIEFVLHQAAVASSPISVDEPMRTTEVNVQGTLQLLLAAKESKVERFVCASSCSVYGNSEKLPFKENSLVMPISPYAVSKYVQELYCYSFYKVYGLPTVSLRYFNVYGPRQRPGSRYSSVIPAFARALLSSSSPVLHGDGLQSRDFIYVEDVVSANISSCWAKGAVGKAINIGSGVETTVVDLLRKMEKIANVSLPVTFASSRPGDLRRAVADTTLASELLNFRAKWSLDEGLKLTLDWLRENLSTLSL